MHVPALDVFNELYSHPVFRRFQPPPGRPVGHLEFFGGRIQALALVDGPQELAAPLPENDAAVLFQPYFALDFDRPDPLRVPASFMCFIEYFHIPRKGAGPPDLNGPAVARDRCSGDFKSP